MKRPVILLDCDGVLADFSSVALRVIEETTGKVYTQEEIPRWDIFESLGLPEMWDEFGERAKLPGFCADIKAYPEAVEAVREFRKEYEVLIVTAPVDAAPWMYERAQWLEKHFEIPRKKVIFAHEKQHVTGQVLVDDKPDNVIAWIEANPDGLGVLWEHAYNRHIELPEGVIRTSDWNELHSILKKRFHADKFHLGN